MESIIFEDSPIAQYLEGQGQAEDEWVPSQTTSEPISPTAPVSYAPRGLSYAHKKGRRKPPPLKLEGPPLKHAIARLHTTFSSALHSRLGWTENALFLEKFRYIIVASQLLNEHSNPSTYRRPKFPGPSEDDPVQWETKQNFVPSLLGLSITGFTAFSLAWSIRWLHGRAITAYSHSRMSFLIFALVTLITVLHFYLRRQWLQYIRAQAIQCASSLTNSAQDLDSAASAGIVLIQEVELVSRGYNISNPLPPVSRLEETNQVKRCVRLRRTIHRALVATLLPCYEAYQNLKSHAIELDLEKYYDIYEISRMDMEDAEVLANSKLSETGHDDTIQDLKVDMQKLHMVRKLLLCALLALSADGSKSDFQRWPAAVDAMSSVSSITAKMTSDIDEVMGDEEDIQAPLTPKMPLTPGTERMRSQMRQLGNLSQGIRGLQAKMRLLRDESNKALEQSEEVSGSGTNLLAQYDSIGGDLKDLVQEWEVGRAALVVNLDRKDHRRSLSTTSNLLPASPTTSLGGVTAVGGSPQDALQALTGLSKPARSRSSTTTTSSSGEEIFEAVALPRQRSTLTRDERIAKMREDRMKEAIVKDKSCTNSHMLKELETVIKLRPRGRTTGRLTSI